MTRVLRLSPPAAAAIGFAGVAVISFHVAYCFGRTALVVAVSSTLLFLYSLLRLPTLLPTARVTFYSGLAIGLAMYGPHLVFFWTLFGPPGAALWAVLAVWVGLFMLLLRSCGSHFGPWWAAACAPVLWTGLEYFRSELYYLRFGWLSPGFVFSPFPRAALISVLGVYGIGFVLAAVAAWLSVVRSRAQALTTALVLIALVLLTGGLAKPPPTPSQPQFLTVAGVQAEFPVELDVPRLLDKAIAAKPAAQLLMLSEYTFEGPPPKSVREWCRRNRRYLVAGGRDVLDASMFYNTAFVVGPDGELVFKQAKSVPIQFFKDGLPAKDQRVWDSPWGPLGICICYDLSYSRVTDNLARQGVRALLVPTMDVMDWGKYEHELHARVAPVRAAEYGIPIFRIASSGVSQVVDAAGRVVASASFGEQESVISGELDLSKTAKLPIDRCLAPLCTLITLLVATALLVRAWRRRAAL